MKVLCIGGPLDKQLVESDDWRFDVPDGQGAAWYFLEECAEGDRTFFLDSRLTRTEAFNRLLQQYAKQPQELTACQ